MKTNFLLIFLISSVFCGCSTSDEMYEDYRFIIALNSANIMAIDGLRTEMLKQSKDISVLEKETRKICHEISDLKYKIKGINANKNIRE